MAAATVVVLAVGGGAWVFWQLRGTADSATADGGQGATGPDGQACEEVLVMTDAGAEEVVREALAAIPAPADGPCVTAQVLDRASADVLRDIEDGVMPDVWVADSSVWFTQATSAGVAVEDNGSLGTTPVVVATGGAAAQALGWTSGPPSWSDVFSTSRGVAVGPLASESAPLLALFSAVQDTRSNAAGTGRLAAELTLGQTRSDVSSAEAGLADISATDAQAPLVLLGAAEALQAGVDSGGPLVSVRPTGPVSPILDYPILSFPSLETSERSAAANAAVVQALTAAAGGTAAVSAGLDPPIGPDSAVLRTLTPGQLTELVAAFELLARPSEILVVVDVSTSMLAPVPGAGSRAEVAAAALQNALDALPPQTRVGLWYFANDIEGERDYRQVLAIERLDAATAAGTQRDSIATELSVLPQSLVPGGTSLYQVTLDAVAAAKEQASPGHDTTILLLTDGQNEDSAGPTLNETTSALGAEPLRAGDETIGFLPVAFGADADLAAVEALAVAAQSLGGLVQPVNASDALALEPLLVAGLTARLER